MSFPEKWTKFFIEYRSHDEVLGKVRLLFTISMALSLITAIGLIYLIQVNAQWGMEIFALSLFGFVVSLPMAIVCFIAVQVYKRRKNKMARLFFENGLRVEANRLVTNVAHSKTVVEVK